MRGAAAMAASWAARVSAAQRAVATWCTSGSVT